MVNHIPKYNSLVILAEQEAHDLRIELERFSCARLSITGTPDHMEALSDHLEIEDLSLSRCRIRDLTALRGLSRLRRLRVAFGPLASVDLGFCAGGLEFLALARLRQLKDLSNLPPMPKLAHLVLNHLHSLVPPDFCLFPNLRRLSIWKTEWPSLSWLSYLPGLETLHVSQCEIRDNDWKPILGLEKLREVHGMQNVFGSAVRKEFRRLRPDVRVDQGIRVDLDEHPQAKEFLEELKRGK